MNTIDGLIIDIISKLDGTKIGGKYCDKDGDIDGALFRIRYNIEDRFIVSKAVKELDELIPDAVKRVNRASDIYLELKDRLEIEGLILDESSFNKQKENEEIEENRKRELMYKVDELEQQKHKLLDELVDI